MERAALFVDGRYTLQVRQQVDASLVRDRASGRDPPHQWLEKNLSNHDVSATTRGCTPSRARSSSPRPARQRRGAGRGRARPVRCDLDRPPAPPLGAVSLHAVAYAGEEAVTKLARIRPGDRQLKADALVVSDPHCVAWTFTSGLRLAAHAAAAGLCDHPAGGRPALYVDGRKLPTMCATSEAPPTCANLGFAGDLAALGAAKNSAHRSSNGAARCPLVTGPAEAQRGPDRSC